MFELILLVIALFGTAVAGWIDLKTTEVPDEIPLFIAASGVLLHLAHSFITGVWSEFISSILVGVLFLVLGYVLYYLGQWGEADVLILGALGFLIPQALSLFPSGTDSVLFPAVFLLNLFMVGGVYAILYAMVISFTNQQVFSSFFKDILSNAKELLVVAVVCVMLAFLTKMTLLVLMTFSFLLIYRFAKVLDKTAFKKLISTKKLKEGDVLAENIIAGRTKFSSRLWVGLEKADIKKIQNLRKKVWIKEGIRYVPAFFFAILVTWLYGNTFMNLLYFFV